MESIRPHFLPPATIGLCLFLLATVPSLAAKNEKKGQPDADPYKEYVWPAPPDQARIKLEAVFSGRIDLEGESKFRKALIGASPKSPWDNLLKPFGVAFDPEGRILVTDSQTGGLIRFDLKNRKFDVLGTQGRVRLKMPLGLDVGKDGTIYVADAGQSSVVALSPDGSLKAVYGKKGDLVNPTDAALSPDGAKLFVSDSKAHCLVIFDAATGEKIGTVGTAGKAGNEPGQFFFPTSLAFSPSGEILVVDQMNARVQLLAADGQYLDGFGGLGVGFGSFVRPKDVAVDDEGLIYVTDNAFNNFQIFDADFSLLTFVGEGGSGPGRFQGLSGIAVQGDRIAAVDQLGRRLQVFRFLVPKSAN